jgi:hypothetical protein
VTSHIWLFRSFHPATHYYFAIACAISVDFMASRDQNKHLIDIGLPVHLKHLFSWLIHDNRPPRRWVLMGLIELFAKDVKDGEALG